MDEFRGNERFEVVRQLGAGGFGAVYEVRERATEQRLALKVLHRFDAPTLYRFKREFRLFADLKHPHLIALHELFSDEDTWFFTMELVQGTDWISHVRRGEVDPEADTLNAAADAQFADTLATQAATTTAPRGDIGRIRATLAQIAAGLQTLHEAGIIHRDMKPSNVVVDSRGRAVILDLGIALVADESGKHLTDANQILGTPAYMAPEQAVSAFVTPAADWYAVGVMLFEALTGRWPFDGSALQVLTSKQTQEAPDPGPESGDAPADLIELCRALLSRAPEKRPGGREMLERMGAAAWREPAKRRQATTSSGGQAHLVGRGPQLEELAQALRQVDGGRQHIVRLEGASGMGKSSLVQTFLSGLDEGVTVLSGRCYQREYVPYKAFDSIVDELSRRLRELPRDEAARVTPRDAAALARLFPVLLRVPAIAEAPRKVAALADAQLLRHRAFFAFRELLARLSDARSVVLFLDDIQWSDEDSARMLVELVMPPEPPPVLLVLACRDGEDTKNPLLLAIDGMTCADEVRAATTTMQLGPLSKQDSETLARGFLAGEDEQKISNLACEAAGHPFLLREMAQQIQESGDESLSGGLFGLIGRRLASLPEKNRRFLEVLCLFGRPASRAVVTKAAGLSTEAASEAIATLKLSSLLRTVGARGEQIEAYHDRIRETVVGMIDPGHVANLHREVALALFEAGDAEPDALFSHCREAGMNEKAAEFAKTAADKASQALAFDHAAQFYRQALALGGLSPAQRRRLSLGLGESLANAGRGPDAAEVFLASLEGGTAAEQLELQRRAAEQLLFAGKVTDGLTVLQAVLVQTRVDLPRSIIRVVLLLLVQRAWLWVRGLHYVEKDASTIPTSQLARIDACWALAGGLNCIDNVRAQVLNTTLLRWTLSCGEPRRLCQSLSIEAAFIASAGPKSYYRSEKLPDKAASLAAKLYSVELDALVVGSRGCARLLSGQWSESAKDFEYIHRLQKEHGVSTLWEKDTSLVLYILALGKLGRLRELSALVYEKLQDARERGDVFLAVSLRISECNWAWLLIDEPELARQQVEDAMSDWKETSYQIQHAWAHQAHMYIDLYQGKFAQGLQRMDSAASEMLRSMVRMMQFADTSWLLMKALCELGQAGQEAQREPRLRRAERLAKKINHGRGNWGSVAAGLILATVAVQRHQQGEAIKHLRRALSTAQSASMALHEAVIRWKLGEQLKGEEGQALVVQGRAWLVEHGAKNPEQFAQMIAPGFVP